MKKSLIFFFLAFLVFSLTLSGCAKNPNNNATSMPAGLVYYGSDSCAHCAKVQEFMDAGNLWAKFAVTKKEISKDTNNQMEFFNVADKCGLMVNGSASIPLLWTGETCVSGDADIINYFKNK